MLISIAEVLDADQRELLNGLLGALVWKDGVETAGRVAAQVKRNQQADLTQSIGPKVEQVLFDAISAHPILRAAAQPNKFSSILVSKTNKGGGKMVVWMSRSGLTAPRYAHGQHHVPERSYQLLRPQPPDR